MSNQRNMILAIVLSAIVLFGWGALSRHFFPVANPPATKIVDGKSVAQPQPSSSPGAVTPQAIRNRQAVLKETPRVVIKTPSLQGSINLRGARIDDLVLTQHKESIASNSKPIRLLSPSATRDAYFAGFGWTGDNIAVPGPDAQWVSDGPFLSPGRPVTLSWTSPSNVVFRIKLSVDNDYLFSIEQSVTNRGPAALALRPYGFVSRQGHSKDPDSWTMHTGPIGTFNGSTDYSVNFDDLDENPAGELRASTGGWIGFGDKYWLTALIPNQKSPIEAAFRRSGANQYQADYRPPAISVAPGATVATSSAFFAGAKEVSLLDRYSSELGIPQLDRAIDWGWFIWFEKPIFYVLDWLFHWAGNFGVAIILLTLVVRGLMFPIAQRQFKSMAAMRVIQPKMKALQEQHKDDKPKLQAEMMKLYQTEKINPLAGCLPIIIQIPIFYALYKVLMITIEMRHQPFYGWIHDLSAPDPLTPVNLFGLLPFTPPGFLHLGVLAILLGITMHLQFKLNPQPMDDIQKQVFGIMPWVFMFVMAPFAAGLQLYWVVSNVLTIAQQKWLYRQYPDLSADTAKKDGGGGAIVKR